MSDLFPPPVSFPNFLVHPSHFQYEPHLLVFFGLDLIFLVDMVERLLALSNSETSTKVPFGLTEDDLVTGKRKGVTVTSKFLKIFSEFSYATYAIFRFLKKNAQVKTRQS